MSKTLPFLLVEAKISLFVADAAGQPILTKPVWVGARAENVELNAEITDVDATPSGAAYDQYAQLSEGHEISIERIWVLPLGANAGPGAAALTDFDLARGRFVMQVFWLDRKTRLWHQRTYYGVQAKRYGLRSNGILHFGSSQVFRAQYFTRSSGTSSSTGALTPLPAGGVEHALLFTHDDPLIEGDYFTGFYQFSKQLTVGFTKAICAKPSVGTDTTIALEVNGAVTAHELTLPQYTAPGEVSDSETLNVIVPAGQSLRWKVMSAPGSTWAEYAGVTMMVTEA